MVCIQLVDKEGGSMTVLGSSPATCKTRVAARHGQGFTYCTVPFHVEKVPGRNIYDVTLPTELKVT